MRIAVGVALLFGVLAFAVPADSQLTSEQRYKQSARTAPPPTLVARYGGDDLRSGQLRLPPGKGPFPVAVVIHGGCWSADFDTLDGIAGFAAALTARGIATWSIEYRRLGDPGAGWPGTFDDVAAGIDYLAVLAKSRPLDLRRVTVVGHSAGAHLALWGASRKRLGADYRPRVEPVSVVAIDGPASLAPFIGVDREACSGRPVITALMGGTPEQKPAAYRLASPADHLPLGLRQLIVQAAFTPFIAPYAGVAKAAGDPVEVLQAGEDHFDIVTPGTPNGQRVIDFIAKNAFKR